MASDEEVCTSQEGSEFDGLQVVSEAEDELGNITPQQFHDDDDAQFKEDLLQQLFGPAPSPRNPRAGQQDYEDSLYAPSDNDVQDLAAPVPVPDSVRESVALLADGNDYEEPADDSVRAADDSAAQAKAPRQNQSRDVHPDSFDWGSFRFTFTDASARPPRGQWQAKCRFHKLNDKTWCTRSMTIGSAEGSKDLTLRLLKGWCVQAGKFKKKKDRARMALRPADALPDEVLDSLLGDMPPVPSLVVPDDQMPDEPEPPSHGPPPDPPRKRKHDSSTGDAIDQGACSVKAKGKAKTKAKAKPKAKAKGMPANAKSEKQKPSPRLPKQSKRKAFKMKLRLTHHRLVSDLTNFPLTLPIPIAAVRVRAAARPAVILMLIECGWRSWSRWRPLSRCILWCEMTGVAQMMETQWRQRRAGCDLPFIPRSSLQGEA